MKKKDKDPGREVRVTETPANSGSLSRRDAMETPAVNGPLSRRGALRWGGLLAGGGLLALFGINPPSAQAQACDDSCTPGCGVVCYKRTSYSYGNNVLVTKAWGVGPHCDTRLYAPSALYEERCTYQIGIRDCDGYHMDPRCTYRIDAPDRPGRIRGTGWVKISDLQVVKIMDIHCNW